MKKLLAIFIAISIFFQMTTVKSSARFSKQFGKKNQQRKYTKSRKKFNQSKLFFYGGGTVIPAASFYYINKKINEIDFKNRIIAEIKKNDAAKKQIQMLSEIGSNVIFCDSFAPLKEICENHVTKALFKGINIGLEKIIREITLENTKRIAKFALKNINFEPTEKQKMIFLFSVSCAAFITVNAIASVYANIRAGQLFFRSNLALSTLAVTSTLLSSILFDEEKLVNSAVNVFSKNQDIVVSVFEQLTFEAKEFTVNQLKKRDAIILLFFKQEAFVRAASKIDNQFVKNIDILIHEPVVIDFINDIFSQLIENIYKNMHEQDSVLINVLGDVIFGSNEPFSKKFLLSLGKYIPQLKNKRLHQIGLIPQYEHLDFSENETILNILYDLFTKKEFDETCKEESSVIIEEVPQEENIVD